MILPSADELEKRVNNKYSLVIAVAKRSKELMEGAPKLVETKSKNPITIALEEIAAGKVKVITPTVAETAARIKMESEERRSSSRSIDMLQVDMMDDLDIDTSLEVEDADVLSDIGTTKDEDLLEEYPLIPADTDGDSLDIEGHPVEEEEEYDSEEGAEVFQDFEESDDK